MRISEGKRYVETFEPQELTQDNRAVWFVSSPRVDGDHLLNADGKDVGKVERLTNE